MSKHPKALTLFPTILFLLHLLPLTLAGLLSEPVPNQPLNTVPAFPLQPESQTCRLDLSDELFGGVNEACGRNLDRSRCCPVLAAWLFAAHARDALQISPNANVNSTSNSNLGNDLPVMPDDSQKCVSALQTALVSKNIKIPQPNASCDMVMCFCGIRLHQITSLSCPAAFSISSGSRNATPTAAVRNLEKSCRNSSYPGCTKCLGALQKLKATNNTTSKNVSFDDKDDNRATKMFNRDCQLMGLTWLLARNKTVYIPTVSAVLRAVMYSSHPPSDSKCSPDQENMPLAVDSLQFEKAQSSAFTLSALGVPVLPLVILVFLFG